MILLLSLLIFCLLLILAVIWWPYVKQHKPSQTVPTTVRDDTNIALYQEHKAELDQEYAQGSIDEENYRYLMAELDKSLLQEIAQSEQPKVKPSQQLSVFWPISLTLFVLVFSVIGYQKLGSYDQVLLAQQQQEQQTATTQQSHQQVTHLIEQLKKNPNDSDLWYQLGQVLIASGEFEKADKAFDQIIKIEGEKADVYGAKAQAQYYAAEQQITPQVQQTIDHALALDPNDPATNILLGMHAYTQQDYQQAITFWQKVIDEARDNVNIAALKQAVTDAQSRLALVQPKTNEDDTISPTLVLNVSIDEAIQAKLSDKHNATVFIYAVAVNGPRMPLAAVKISVADLPTQIVLDKSKAMSPQFTLASVDNVNVFAVISMHNTPGIQSGDYKGELANVDVSTSAPLNLVIDRQQP